MNISCSRCGKTIAGEGAAFCPYCGAKLNPAEKAPETTNAEAEKWIKKALASNSYPERKKILQKGLQACPDSREIEWELLFIGTPDPKPQRGKIDFSIIKSWLLQIYRTPGDFSAEKRDAMRRELFESPQLQAVLAGREKPEEKMREYLERLCREYTEIFLKEDNRLMGNIFGLRIGRNRDKVLENAVDSMIRQMDADEKLTPERRQMLQEAMRKALGR